MKVNEPRSGLPLAKRLRKGLMEGIEFARGERELQVREIPIPEGRTYTSSEVVGIRKRYGLSQIEFAKYLMVSVKTLQSWEQGLRTPSGPTMRLLQVFDEPDRFYAMFGLPK